jgi:hypothetical protein
LINATTLSSIVTTGVPQMAHFLIAPVQSGQDRRRASTYRGVLWACCAHTMEVHDHSQRFGPEGRRPYDRGEAKGRGGYVATPQPKQWPLAAETPAEAEHAVAELLALLIVQ